MQRCKRFTMALISAATGEGRFTPTHPPRASARRKAHGDCQGRALYGRSETHSIFGRTPTRRRLRECPYGQTFGFGRLPRIGETRVGLLLDDGTFGCQCDFT